MREWLIAALAGACVGLSATAAEPSWDRAPRKVIVGTVVQSFWGKYPGLDSRLAELAAIVDRMGAEARRKYGRGLDIAVLPEVAVTGEISGDIVGGSVPFDGPVREVFARKARECGCYIVVPLFLLENREKRICSNAAVLVDRRGEVAGIYRKLHLAVQTGSDSLEGGISPGKKAPVFACDFGKLGIQICFDMEFDYGWSELARQGADLVVWPTQSPQTVHPASRALRDRCYIVSSTWRDNATVFEPTGKIAAHVRAEGQVLAQEIDLSYAILPWSPALRKGAAFQEKYGANAGFHYYEDEDAGLFWSNDPRTPVGVMMRTLGLNDSSEEHRRILKLFRSAGVPDPE